MNKLSIVWAMFSSWIKLTKREHNILACCEVLKRKDTSKELREIYIDKIEKLVLKMIKF